jgi:4-amino-4-deoxy-L-arabinose transferase-like glycosyltransferase
MRFQIDHDWQSNMSEPRAQLGDTTKTQLLLLLCAIWIFVGLVGHAPWKPLEIQSISIVKSIVDGGSLITPIAHNETTLSSPPLYYLTAALSTKLFSPLLDTHDSARLFNSVWLTILLLMVGMTGRELWSKGIGRHATFITIGTIGLLLSAHSLNTQIGAFTAIATGFYAISLAHRRPRRATLLFATALAVAFLTNGILSLFILLAPPFALFIIFKAWRNKRFFGFIYLSILIASAPIAGWALLAYVDSPVVFSDWLFESLNNFKHSSHLYYLRTLIWYGWPALPLSLLGLWRYRAALLNTRKFQLILVFFITTLLLLGFGTSGKDIYSLPLLLPLIALGAGSVEILKRSLAAALNWFGVTLFATFGSLIWLGWVGMITGYPEKIQERMRFLSGAYTIDFNMFTFALAIFITLVWLMISIRAKLTKRSTVTNWAIGMTFIWSLLMTLWLPMIDNAKSYGAVFARIENQLPSTYSCINSLNVGRSQAKLLHYYTGITLQPLQQTELLDCDVYLIQDEKGRGKMTPGPEWKLIWQGKRPADRRENFRLFELD